MLRSRVLLAVLVALVMSTSGVGVAEATVETEHYDSVAEVTRAADLVVLGRIVSTEAGRVIGGCGASATLEVDRVLARRVDVPQQTLTIEYSGSCGSYPSLGDEIPAEIGIFFLRNKGIELSRLSPDATEDEVERESNYWRLVIWAGTIVERGGLAHVPQTYNARFLEKLDGRPFGDVVGEIRALGALPATDSVSTDLFPTTTGSPTALYLALGVLAFILAVLRGPWGSAAKRDARDRPPR